MRAGLDGAPEATVTDGHCAASLVLGSAARSRSAQGYIRSMLAHHETAATALSGWYVLGGLIGGLLVGVNALLG